MTTLDLISSELQSWNGLVEKMHSIRNDDINNIIRNSDLNKYLVSIDKLSKQLEEKSEKDKNFGKKIKFALSKIKENP
ncbi:hypothetical protein ACFL1H_07340, partial [Nanoarchaeota archaeon]